MSDISCPSCERDNFDSEKNMKIHHKHEHGESIAKKVSECRMCGKNFEYYPSTTAGKECSDCTNRNLTRENKWSAKNEELLQEKYPESGYDIPELLENKSKRAINTKAQRMGITSDRTPKDWTRKDADRNFFSTIDTERKAYWLGFILADGSLKKTKRSHSLNIHLSEIDKHHLEKFRRHIESEHKISIGKNNDCSISIGGKELSDDLGNHGIDPNKTGKVDPSDADVPRKFLSDFWRGIIDGDGGISISSRKDERYDSGYNEDVVIYVTGSRETCKAFKNYVREVIRITTSASIYESDSCQFSVGGSKNAVEVVKEIYENSSVYLDRKKEIADKVMSGNWRKHD